MDSGLLSQGLELMLVGMGTVFAFLTLLVLATSLMSRAVQRFLPAPSTPGGEMPANDARQGEEVAAIAAALELHHRRRR